MALAIGNAIRSQQRMTLDRKDPSTKDWTPSMWEDYDRADARTKKYLMEKWGQRNEY